MIRIEIIIKGHMKYIQRTLQIVKYKMAAVNFYLKCV